MLIEFLGVPGCGKSTLSRYLAELLLDRQFVVEEPTYDIDHRRSKFQRRGGKLRHILTYAALNPRSAFTELKTILGTRQASVADLRRAVFNWFFVRSVAARRRAPGVVTVLDQGLAQALWTTGFAAKGAATWLELLRGRPAQAPSLPSLVVHVRAHSATVGDRLDKRRHHASRMDRLGRDPNALRRADDIVGLVASRLRVIGVPVVEVDNNDAEQLMLGVHRIASEILIRLDQPQTDIRAPSLPPRSMEEPARSRLVKDEASLAPQHAAPAPRSTPVTVAAARSDLDA